MMNEISQTNNNLPQLSESAKQRLIEQGYRIIGNHSAVKVCGWTRSMIRGNGGCYKLIFYGIMSHQCMQMTSSISCANRCTFCWRGYKAPISKDWKWGVDDPHEISEKTIQAHKQLLVGFKSTKPAMYTQAQSIKHVALSLTGEPIIYPKINELIDLYHQQGISTFLVTNAQYPEAIQNLKRVTQLYVSVDAPNKTLLKEVDKPIFEDYWERLLLSLKILSEKKDRTTIRLTIIKDINDIEHKNYAELIELGKPDFVEIKGYMFIGPSRQRLKKENMPTHEEIRDLAQKINIHLQDYDIVTEHVPSTVVLLAHKKFFHNNNWNTWIDYPKFFELLKSQNDFEPLDFCTKTPKIGISNMTTQDYYQKRREYKMKNHSRIQQN